MRLYPASFNRPRTAFSFDLLDTPQSLSSRQAQPVRLLPFYHAKIRQSRLVEDNGKCSMITIVRLYSRIPNSIDIMRSCAVPVSGDTSKVSNMVVAFIKHTLFLQHRLDHSRSNALLALIWGETFRKIGMLPRVPTSEYFCFSACNPCS